MVGEDEVSDDEGSFNTKSVWARMSIIAAGPIFNFILAFLFSWIIIGMIGYDKPEIYEVIEDGAAQEAGMQGGDLIKELNGQRIHLYKEVQIYQQLNPGKTVEIIYERDGENHEVVIEPKLDEESGNYYMGFLGAGKRVKANPFETVKYSYYEVKYWITTTFKSLKLLVTGNVSMDEISGPVGIVNVIGETYEESKESGWYYIVLSMLNISILMSANLGVMNLIPIPALDGGRLVFLVIEAIRGKKISPEKEGFVHFTGLVLLMILMVVVMFNDIKNIFL